LDKSIMRTFLTIISSMISIILFGKYIALTDDENIKIKTLLYTLKSNLVYNK
jgi:hypothetical protein